MEPDFIPTDIPINDLLRRWPQAIPVFLRRQMACVGCNMSAFDTLADAAGIYQVPLETLQTEITAAIGATPPAANIPSSGENL